MMANFTNVDLDSPAMDNGDWQNGHSIVFYIATIGLDSSLETAYLGTHLAKEPPA